MNTKRKIIVVGQLPNWGKFESGNALSPEGICRALKAWDFNKLPIIEVDDETMDNRKFLSKPRDADI